MMASKKSPHTLADYQTAYRYFTKFLQADPPISEITKNDVVAFMAAMATDTTPPNGIAARPAKPRSKKTLLNYHIALSSLWSFAVAEGYVSDHIVHQVPRPKPHPKAIEAYTDQEIRAMAQACKRTASWKNKPLVDSERVTASRDMAIILLLVDVGLRNAELRDLTMNDVDWKNNRVIVRQGKGDKMRILTFGNETRRALRRYLQDRSAEAEQYGDYLFVNMLRYRGHKMNSAGLTKMIRRIGNVAGVKNATVHRFRHTAAIKRLQAGMDAFQVKEMMGHSQMETTMRYVRIAQVDLQDAMKRTSPVDNLRL